MAARKRTKSASPLALNRNSPLPANALVQACAAFGSELQKLVEVYHAESERLRSQGHQEAAAIVEHLARRLTAVTDFEDLLPALTEVAEIQKWLPLSDEWCAMPRELRTARLIVGIHQENFDTDSRENLLSVLQRPGRPPETRAFAIPALELRREGLGWNEIEKRLLPHRRHAGNSGKSIYREVQFLRQTLRRYGLRLENL